VPAAKDFPLTRFTSRIDTATKAVGYDKSMLVFHILRKEIGEEAFWGALRDIYRERLFQPTTWDDLRGAFEKRSQRSLDSFFEQWVSRKGAPQIHLENVLREKVDDGWHVSGRLVQEKPYFKTGFDLTFLANDRLFTERLELAGDSATFNITTTFEPDQVIVDPDANMLRRLAASEVPPTVNALKSSSETLIVVCGSENAGVQRLGETLAGSLGLRHFSIVAENLVDPNQFKRQDVILLGYPRQVEWLRTGPSNLKLLKDGFEFSGADGGGGTGDLFFGVFTHPFDSAFVMGVLLPPTRAEAAIAAGKITHYGKFSYLIFRDGQVYDRGTWEPTDSQVRHVWN